MIETIKDIKFLSNLYGNKKYDASRLQRTAKKAKKIAISSTILIKSEIRKKGILQFSSINF